MPSKEPVVYAGLARLIVLAALYFFKVELTVETVLALFGAVEVVVLPFVRMSVSPVAAGKKAKPPAVAVLALALVLPGCSVFKSTTRGISDAAAIVCETVAVDMTAKQRAELSPREWCQIHENVKPYLDDLLRAQRAGAIRAGVARE